MSNKSIDFNNDKEYEDVSEFFELENNDRIGQCPTEKILDYWTGLIGNSPLQVQLSLYSPINIIQW